MAIELPHIHDIFNEALARDSEEDRRRFIDEVCGNDLHVRVRVEALLRAHAAAGGFFGGQSPAPAATIVRTVSEVPGTKIGPYKLRELLGEGGMGTVYVAEQEQPIRRKVALKIIKPGMDTKQVIARFDAERQALALMDHPNIAKALDAGTTESGRPYFVMELVRGIPVTDFCDQHGLDTRQRLEIFIQVCRAIQHAHQKGIIHRDIKPTNVLVALHDDKAVPKVIDFGIAKAASGTLTRSMSEGQGEGYSIYTGFAQMIGTPLYMSPEQAELNALDVDTRSDVYSLGVLLYELLTGTTPIGKERLKSVGFDEMRRIIREEEHETVSARLAKTRRVGPARAASAGPPNGEKAEDRRWAGAALVPPYGWFSQPKTENRKLQTSSELDWITSRSLEKDRSRRYESASALAADLQRYLNGDLVHACPPSAAYRFSKFARKNKTALTTTAIVAASLLLGTGLSIWQAIRATQAETLATSNEAKAKGEEQKALAAAQSEATQRQRAEASEQEAKKGLVEVERQRKQAEKNFLAALDAVDRLLANSSDPDLNDVPRVGPLRRKMLKDAIAFYERIPALPETPEIVRQRIAGTWDKIAEISYQLDEYETVRHATKMALTIMTQLATEQPKKTSYLAILAEFHHHAGWHFIWHIHDTKEAERQFRRSSELYAEAISATALTWSPAAPR